MASLLLLAVAVLALRAAGHAVGWGFQFQEPLFVAVLSGVVLLFALNLLGDGLRDAIDPKLKGET